MVDESASGKHRAMARASWLIFIVALLVNVVGKKAGAIVLAEVL